MKKLTQLTISSLFFIGALSGAHAVDSQMMEDGINRLPTFIDTADFERVRAESINELEGADVNLPATEAKSNKELKERQSFKDLQYIF